jgi:hypothetical protein
MSNEIMTHETPRTPRGRIRSVRRHRRFARLAREEDGQGIVEFALALPIILVILLGMVEFAHAYDRVHGMAGISREGANIASRGTALSDVLEVVMADGQTIDMDSRGGAVVSRVVVRQGTPTVENRIATDGYETESRLDNGPTAAQWIASAGYAEGSTHYVVEVFLTYEPVTPLSRLLRAAGPDQLYQRAVF